MNISESRRKIASLYLEYVNDFLTVKRFAEYHQISKERAERIIKVGKVENFRINNRLHNNILIQEYMEKSDKAETKGNIKKAVLYYKKAMSLIK
jgi:DNA-binding protein H-NS